MQRWEYMTMGASANAKALNAFGEQGWELVGVLSGPPSLLYFKRPLPDPQGGYAYE